MTYQIISDSTCDLSPEQIERYSIRLMPLFVHLGDGEYRDGVDIHPDDIYAHVAAGGALASTAAVNLADYVQVFSEYSRKVDFVIHIDISSDFPPAIKTHVWRRPDMTMSTSLTRAISPRATGLWCSRRCALPKAAWSRRRSSAASTS